MHHTIEPTMSTQSSHQDILLTPITTQTLDQDIAYVPKSTCNEIAKRYTYDEMAKALKCIPDHWNSRTRASIKAKYVARLKYGIDLIAEQRKLDLIVEQRKSSQRHAISDTSDDGDESDFDDEADFGASDDIIPTPASTEFTRQQMADLLETFHPTHAIVAEMALESWTDASDEAVETAFNERFQYLSIEDLRSIKDDPVSNVPPGMHKVTDTLVRYERLIKSQQRAANESRRVLTRKKKRSTTAYQNLRRQWISESCQYSVGKISYYLGTEATRLAHDGSSTYAEPTNETMVKVSESLKTLMGSAEDRREQGIVDCGSGTGTAIWTMSALLGCKGLGIEYAYRRLYTGSSNTTRFLQHMEETGSPVHGRAVNTLQDLYMGNEFPACVTVMFSNDEAFPPALLRHCLSIFVNSSTVRWLVSSKLHRPSFSEMINEHGLEKVVGPIVGKKTGSGESTTFYIYKTNLHRTRADEERKPFEIPRETEQIWKGDRAAMKAYYHSLTESTSTLMSQRRERRARIRETCISSFTFEHCGDHNCGECRKTFKHQEMVHAKPVPWLPGQMGLFPKKDVPKEQFITEYCGKHSRNSGGGSWIVQIATNHYVDAKDQGEHQFINHSCEPNCEFRKWIDWDGNHRLSIYTKRKIAKDEELTVDYGDKRELFHCQCSRCYPRDNCALFLGVTQLDEATLATSLCVDLPLNPSQMIDSMLKLPHTRGQLRDSLRVAYLKAQGWCTFSLSLENNADGAAPTSNFHMNMSWNKKRFVEKLKSWNVNKVHKVEMDYVWMEPSFVAQKLLDGFYTEVLPLLADIIMYGGDVVLPAQLQILSKLVQHQTSLEPYYRLEGVPLESRASASLLYKTIADLKEEYTDEQLERALGKKTTGKHCSEYTITKHAVSRGDRAVKEVFDHLGGSTIYALRLVRIRPKRLRVDTSVQFLPGRRKSKMS